MYRACFSVIMCANRNINNRNMIGIMTLAGPGAGRFPTANSVMNDLIRLSLNKTSDPFPLSTDIPLQSNYTTGFYVRIKCSDGKY